MKNAYHILYHFATLSVGVELSKGGKIPSVRIGRVWRFDKEVIDEWIAKG
jgi:excisionase family DNA binding protein